MELIKTAFSSCPNDTFIFDAMVHGKIDINGFVFEPHIADVDELNKSAFSGIFELTKLSFYAFFLLRKRYILLDAGCAIGYGCGPILVAKNKTIDIETDIIAIPGQFTTAHLLLRLWNPNVCTAVLRFDEILPAVRDGKFSAGLVIHEGRFVYKKYGLVEIVDLGQWWEKLTSLPIPLGCIALRNDCEKYYEKITGIMKASVKYACSNPSRVYPYVRSLAQEMEDEIIQKHITLYVNEFTHSLGKLGKKAIATLEEIAQHRGVL
ncbi:MAG: 1,4-dihydroxy-6-naphthoate synthase [Spirochaetes bacterium]|nr:1,4-dihydroxy-6-naphthoate synthase [Spirochaetota bacterium]